MTTDTAQLASLPGGSMSAGQLFPTPVDLDPERRLAAAVLNRAVRDINGSHCTNGSRQERVAPFEALTFIEDAGEAFTFWGRRSRAAMLAVRAGGSCSACHRKGSPRCGLLELWPQSGAGG